MLGKPHMAEGDDAEEGDDASEHDLDTPSEEEIAAAKELRAAIKGSDDTLLAQALKNFMAECVGDKHEDY